MFSSVITEAPALAHAARRREWLLSLRSARSVALLAIGLALVLVSPCLWTGWVADDWLQLLMLRREPGVPGLLYRPLDSFRFATGDAQLTRQLVDAGVFPWWVDPDAVLAFFRPLSSATHLLDHWLWPERALPAHLHSLLWFALLLAVVAALYHRFSDAPGLSALGLLLFAVDDAHAPSVGWIANRNLLVALTLSLPALLLHDRQRQGGLRTGSWWGALALGLGLAAGEGAVVTGAYLLAYAVCYDRGPWRVRLRSLLPYAGVFLCWRVAYAALGYGALHSGLYVDPLRSPLRFVGAVLERLPVLASSQLGLLWADFWEIYPLTLPWLRPIVWGSSCVVLVAFIALVRPAWKESRSLRFWSAGALLGLVPMCATFPHDRLLLGAGVGVMPLIAWLLRRAWRQRTQPGSVAVGVLLGLSHLALAPMGLLWRSAHVDDFAGLLGRADQSLPDGSALEQNTLILVNPPLDPFAAYFSLRREAEHRARPRHLLWLATSTTALSVTTVDERTLLLSQEAGFLASSSQWMLRDPAAPPRPGQRIITDQASFEVMSSTREGRPLDVQVQFQNPLRDQNMLWMQWRGHAYAPLELPAPGHSVVLPAADLAEVLLGG
jgi:hypothetical protein